MQISVYTTNLLVAFFPPPFLVAGSFIHKTIHQGAFETNSWQCCQRQEDTQNNSHFEPCMAGSMRACISARTRSVLKKDTQRHSKRVCGITCTHKTKQLARSKCFW
uniref:Putative secreted protein n=1 Tax=Ixodes ricinus TaxID=34613 RepID=A0A6B0UI01_IXORI